MCLVCSSKFWICGQNPMVWPFKWNHFGGISTWYYFSAFYKKNWSLLEVSGLALEIVDCSCDCCFVQSTLDVPERNIAALQEADLSKGMGLKECTHAAFSVLHALQTDLSPGTSQSLHFHFKRFFQIYKCLLHLGYLDSQALAFISRSENVYLDTKYFLQILAWPNQDFCILGPGICVWMAKRIPYQIFWIHHQSGKISFSEWSYEKLSCGILNLQ